MDPIISIPFKSGTDLSIFGFCPNSNSILVGDTDGQINVYQLRGFDDEYDSQAFQKMVDAVLSQTAWPCILYLYLEPNLSASLGPRDICGVKGNLKVRLVMWNGGGANSVTEDIQYG